MVVRRPPEHHRRAEGADRRVPDAGVDDGGDPGAAALGAQAVLVVVAPDEELRPRQADPLDQLAGDQHAVERDHDARGSARRHRGRSTSAIACTTRVPPGSRIGKTSRLGFGLVDDDRAPEVERRRVLEQGLEAVGLGQAVVVHQPDQVGPALDRPAQALVEAAGAAGVGRSAAGVRRRPGSAAEPARPCRRCEALSTTRTSSSPSVSASRWSRRWSRSSRLKVTTTAAMRRPCWSVTAPPSQKSVSWTYAGPTVPGPAGQRTEPGSGCALPARVDVGLGHRAGRLAQGQRADRAGDVELEPE